MERKTFSNVTNVKMFLILRTIEIDIGLVFIYRGNWELNRLDVRSVNHAEFTLDIRGWAI